MEHLTTKVIPNQAQQHLQVQRQDDEIDLKEILVSLWKGRLVIALVSILFFLVAMTYSLLSAEKWEAKALIAEPDLSQFQLLQNQVGKLSPSFSEISSNGAMIRNKKLDDFLLPSVLLESFVQQFKKQKNKKTYLKTNVEFRKRLDALEKGDNEKLNKIQEQKLYQTWYKRLEIKKRVKPQHDKTSDTYQVIAESKTSEESYELLLGYLSFIDKKTRLSIQKNLTALISGKKNEIKQQVYMLKEQAKSQLLVEKLKSKYELNIARNARISRPLENYDVDLRGVFSVALGAEALEAKVNVLNDLENLSLFEPMIAQKDAKLSLLYNLKVVPDLDFQVMQYIETPEKPFILSAPNKKVISILGGGSGLGLGIIIVLLGAAFRKNKRKN
ncbi:Wzz/FepE/Etk N-terminal domain-containing protein [Marinomonas sp. PE14-40]|uniref:Wzz/FepE/Etk N-terminal domain-containing protein n=1 Tax=Marinomonas sp. PE14-40 TaxID=3060621 RepID=UPI003F67B057